MMAHQRGARLRVLAGAFGTLLIAWGVEEIWRETLTVRAQQDNWTTPTAQRMGIRLLESHDAGGSVDLDLPLRQTSVEDKRAHPADGAEH